VIKLAEDKVFVTEKITNKHIYDEIKSLRKDLSTITNNTKMNSVRIKILGAGIGFIALVVTIVGFAK
jgi:hypothetical protein